MKKRKNILVKLSGDVLKNPHFYAWLLPISRANHVVIVVGGGSQINREFTKKKIPIIFGPAGREIRSFRDRQIARDILEENQRITQDLCVRHGVNATIEIPVISSGTVLCHVNGDQYVRTCYNGFDTLYVLTTKKRFEGKVEEFKDFPKVEVITFS